MKQVEFNPNLKILGFLKKNGDICHEIILDSKKLSWIGTDYELKMTFDGKCIFLEDVNDILSEDILLRILEDIFDLPLKKVVISGFPSTIITDGFRDRDGNEVYIRVKKETPIQKLKSLLK